MKLLQYRTHSYLWILASVVEFLDPVDICILVALGGCTEDQACCLHLGLRRLRVGVKIVASLMDKLTLEEETTVSARESMESAPTFKFVGMPASR